MLRFTAALTETSQGERTKLRGCLTVVSTARVPLESSSRPAAAVPAGVAAVQQAVLNWLGQLVQTVPHAAWPAPATPRGHARRQKFHCPHMSHAIMQSTCVPVRRARTHTSIHYHQPS